MPALYHERQTLYRCGLHALNNALQGPVFSQAALDDACEKLAATTGSAWIWNPHRAPFALGNYDVNALTYALQQQGTCGGDRTVKSFFMGQLAVGYVMQWLDKRQPVDTNLVQLDDVEGIVCNVVVSSILSSVWTQRHWFALRKIDGVCYNLDSKLEVPMPFATETECYEFVQELVNTGECEVFTITKEGTAVED